MHLVFADLNRQVISELAKAFGDIPHAEFHVTEIGQAATLGFPNQAIINAGNSYSMQDGGIDSAISYFVSTPHESIEKMTRASSSCFTTQNIVDEQYLGQLPIGSAVMVRSPNPKISHMIYAPTMYLPENVGKTYNAYAAFRAALVEIVKYNRDYPNTTINTVLCGGLATGTGEMKPSTCAKQMRLAWDSICQIIPHRWREVTEHHRKLSDTFRD